MTSTQHYLTQLAEPYCQRLGIAVPTIYTHENLARWCRLVRVRRAAYYGQACRAYHAILVRVDRLRTPTMLLATLVHELVHLRFKSYTERQVCLKVEELTGVTVEEQLRHDPAARYAYRCPRPGCRYIAYFRRRVKRAYVCGFCRCPRPRLVAMEEHL